MLEACGRAGARAAIVISGGFSESSSEGRELEERMVERAHASGIRVVGPNTMGIFTRASPPDCADAPVRPLPGSIAFAAQSGNLGTQMLGFGAYRGVGFSRFVCIGNECDLDFVDYLEYFARDDADQRHPPLRGGVQGPPPFLRRGPGDQRLQAHRHLQGGRHQRREHRRRFPQRRHGRQPGDLPGHDRPAGSGPRHHHRGDAGHLRRPGEDAPAAGQPGGHPHLGRRVGRGHRGPLRARGAVGGSAAGRIKERFAELLPSYWSKGNPVDLVGVFDIEAHVQCLKELAASDAYDAVISLGTINANVSFQDMMGGELVEPG